MTTAFQYIFDQAETISIDRKAVVAQTITRDQTLRSVSRGGRVWRFDVKLPDGIAWTTLRPIIESIEYADRYTIGIVQINNAGYNTWLTPYQGVATSTAGWTGSWTQGSNIVTVTPVGYSSGVLLKAGDVIQLGTGHVYSVATDATSTSVTVSRPILDATGSGTIYVGPAVTWSVVCTELPTWTIFSRNQVSWSGSFKFVESLV